MLGSFQTMLDAGVMGVYERRKSEPGWGNCLHTMASALELWHAQRVNAEAEADYDALLRRAEIAREKHDAGTATDGQVDAALVVVRNAAEEWALQVSLPPVSWNSAFLDSLASAVVQATSGSSLCQEPPD